MTIWREVLTGFKTILWFPLFFYFHSEIAFAGFVDQLAVSNKMVYFDTKLGDETASMVSLAGVGFSYAYRPNFFSSVYADYSAVTGNNVILLNGFSGGFDYAIFGGSNYRDDINGQALFAYNFPLRIGALIGGTFQNYNLGNITSEQRLSNKKRLASSGRFFGAELGFSFEFALTQAVYLSGKTSFAAPFFSSDSDQTGRLFALYCGLGYSM